MINIPRRKIYETMLEFEDALLGIEVLTYSEDHFKKFRLSFVEKSLPKLETTFEEIKALLVMFFENEKFNSKEAFQKKLDEHLKKEEETKNLLLNNKHLPESFKETIPKIEKKIKDPNVLVKDFSTTKENFELLDKFNHFIPKILELRRDEIQ